MPTPPHDARAPILRTMTANDVDSVLQLFSRELGRNGSSRFVLDCLETHPSVVATVGDDVVGFAYCRSFAPDILELANILVDSELRDHGVGSRLVQRIAEEARVQKWHSLVAVNSLLYESSGKKRFASHFYAKNNFESIYFTGQTHVYLKQLG